MGERYDMLIVGGGHGGAQAAIMLSQLKVSGSIAVVGDEPELPYERPPLSKEYLSGDKPFERILIRPASFWAGRDIAMLGGTRIVAVDPVAHEVMTGAGETIGYGTLIWAAGGRARRLRCPGSDLAGVHAIRTRADVDRLLAELPNVARVAVIGGGYIGLEAAAVLRKLGREVVLLEAQDRVLARVAGEPLSRFYEAEHRRRGVDVRLGVAVEAIEGTDRVSGVRLATGETVPCDLVIVGIGIAPEVEPLLAAGAEGGNGVAVDARCRTSLLDIFAIGDCALHRNRFADGAAIRLESVQNANDQASVVAKTLAGQEASYEATPWFWSNQYDLKLQTVGLSIGHDGAVLRGDPEARAFSLVYLKQGRVVALDCVNRVKDYVQGRKLVEQGTNPDRVLLADGTIELKALV